MVVLAAVLAAVVAVLVGHLFLYIKINMHGVLRKFKNYLVNFFSHSCMGESVGTGVTVLGW